MANPSRFLLEESLSTPGEYVLGREESHHAANVLRHQPGDKVVVFDGRGNYAEATVREVGKNTVRVTVADSFSEPSSSLFLTVATAIPKGKRWQILVEKCTELAADRIIPLVSERSVAKGEGDIGKWRRWLIEAAKQSRRAWLPEIVNPMAIVDLLALTREEETTVFVADPEGASPETFRELFKRTDRAMVLIGPEGGFSVGESGEFTQAGVAPIRLASSILRVETAAAAACAIVRGMLL